MISTLQAFLITAAREKQEKEIRIGERFPEPFTIRALSMNEWEEIQKKSTDPEAAKRVDGLGMLRRVAIEGCINPDFKSEEFLGQLGVATSMQGLEKALKAGEVTRLANSILKFSGFAEDVEKARKEAQD